MATDPSFSQAGAVAALNALLALLNVGGAGTVKVLTGSPPATLETADSGTLLATLTLSATAFPTATTITSPFRGAEATANSITSDTSADATGTAGYFRATNNAGTNVIQGTAGTSSADLILNTTSIVSGATVAITSWVARLADGD